MSDIGKSALKNLIDTAVVENETGAITGTVMNGVLQDTVDTLANGENLDAGSIKTANIADSAITTAKVANGAITEGKIGSGAVTSGKIGDGAVTAAKIGSKAVETAKLDDAAVTTAKIADGAVTADKVGAGAVTTGKIGAKAVTTAKLDDKAVTTAKVDDSAITTDKIANGNVTTAKINDGAVSADKIDSSAVTEAKIADGAVTSDKIAAGGITSAKINDGAVTTAKIADGAVSSDKLGAGAVTTTKIYDGNVTGAKIADSTIIGAKIASNTIETGNIKAKAVTTAKIDDAAVDTAQIKDSAVTTDKLATSAVTTVKVNDGAVTTAKIADANVTTAKIADGNVTTAKIADNNITTAKVADGAITDAKLANPISVSQDAEAGTTTITVGEDSYDVATEPVSVSQNTSVTAGDKIGSIGTTPIRNAVHDETFGLQLGYFAIGVNNDWNHDDITRATTKIINGVNKPIVIKTTGYTMIAGVFKFDENYNQLDYISVNSDTYTTPIGYYYAIVFRNGDSSSNVDLEYTLNHIYIGLTNDIKVLAEDIKVLAELVGLQQIKLAKWGSAGSPTDLVVGDIYTSNGTNLIRVDAISGGEVTQYTELPFVDGAVYICDNKLYIYNGTMLVEPLAIDRSKPVFYENVFFGNILAQIQSSDGKTTKIRDFIQNDIYGLMQGYWLQGYSDDTTRVSTKLLDGIATPIDVKITNPVFAIAGYMIFDANYSYIEYINSGFDAQHITLPAGYIYEIVFKRNSGGDLIPSDVAPYIVINDRLRIYNLEQKTASFIDTVIDVATLAEANTWYQGTNIGDTITSGTYAGCYALKQAVTPGDVYQLTAKGANGGRGWYLLDADNKIVDLSGVNFNDTINITIPNGVAYLLIQSNDGLSHLALTKYGQVNTLSVKVEELKTSVENIETDITNIKNMADSFKCLTPFVWNKLSRMKNQESGFCNIGFIGDSWTQGTENIVDGVPSGYAGYVEPLTKLLQDEYGFGGLGWLDFARDGGVNKMFGCVDLYKRWTYQFSGTVTGLDGNNDQQAPNCLGICCAHTIFGNGASLTLGFDANILDVFKIRYYKNAHFNVSVNGGTPVEVTANANDGWQETTFGTTGTNITSVVITSLADNTIIFGMDCFFGTKGVRCHKIGNRSIEASDYLLMNAEQWEMGISMLNLCWCSVLLAINDLGGSTSETRMNTIVTNISNLINRLKVATDDGNGLVTCDINVLGVDNIENSGWTGLGALAQKQKAMALANGYGWCSTDKCIGSKKAEFVYNGTFSDQIHLNKIGSYAYAKHIYDTLFDF